MIMHDNGGAVVRIGAKRLGLGVLLITGGFCESFGRDAVDSLEYARKVIGIAETDFFGNFFYKKFSGAEKVGGFVDF